LPINLDHPK